MGTAYLCVLLSREACDPSSDSVNSKILCALCDLCVRKENICMVVICLTQRAQRTRSFIFHTVHAGAGVIASFTTTGKRREGRNIWYCLCYKRIFYIFVVTINDNIV